MSKYQPYPSYKESSVEWIGDVPEHWDTFQLKRSVDGCTNGIWGNDPDGINDLTVLRVADYNRDNFLISTSKLTTRSIPNKDRKTRLLKKGDLLLEKSGGGENQLVGAVVTFNLDIDAVTSNFVAKMTPHKNFNPRFLTYGFSHLYSGRINYMSIKQNTGIQNLDSNQYLSEYFSFPPLSEQTAIANFLDRETAKIDTLIEKQQRLIELLKEKRQSVISNAVAKGLDPNVKMKDSGVEWLGEVPEHWDVKKVKYLFEIRKRISGELGYPILSITQKGIKVKDTESGKGQLSMDYSKYQFVEVGDFAMNHMDLLTGYVDISKHLGVTSPDYRVFAARDKHLVTQYFLYLFQMGYTNKIFYGFGQGSSQFGRWRLPTDQFENFYFPYPSYKVQQEIADYLDQKLSIMGKLEEKAKQAILLLKERRTALVSAAVTGKIDVRGMNSES